MVVVNNLKKVKDIILKNNKLIFVSVITVLLFFANLFSPLWIVAVVFTLGFYSFLNVGESIKFLLRAG